MKKSLPIVLAVIFAVAFTGIWARHFANQPNMLTREIQLCPRLRNLEYVLESDLPVFDKEQTRQLGNPKAMCDVDYQKGYLTLTLQGGDVTVTLIGQTPSGKIHRANFYQEGSSIFYSPVDGAKKPGENPVIVYHQNDGTISLLGLLGLILFGLIGRVVGIFFSL